MRPIRKRIYRRIYPQDGPRHEVKSDKLDVPDMKSASNGIEYGYNSFCKSCNFVCFTAENNTIEELRGETIELHKQVASLNATYVWRN